MALLTDLWTVEGFSDLQLLKATSDSHNFPRHWHDHYVIEIVESGNNEFYCEGKHYSASAGTIVVINPGEIHTGNPAGKGPLRYRSFYAFAETLQETVCDDPVSLPFFPQRVIYDLHLKFLLCRAHIALEQRDDMLESHSLLIEAFSELIRRYADPRPPEGSESVEPSAISQVKIYLNEKYSEAIPLRDLAKISGLSPFHLLRMFKKHVGLPPFEYLRNVRVERAKQMLARGLPIIDAAFQSGFYDQSHLNRSFKRLIGLSPGRYRAISSKTTN